MKKLITGILLGATLLTPTICLAAENQNLGETNAWTTLAAPIQKEIELKGLDLTKGDVIKINKGDVIEIGSADLKDGFVKLERADLNKLEGNFSEIRLEGENKEIELKVFDLTKGDVIKVNKGDVIEIGSADLEDGFVKLERADLNKLEGDFSKISIEEGFAQIGTTSLDVKN